MKKLISETAQNDIKPGKILGVVWNKIDDTFIYLTLKKLSNYRKPQQVCKEKFDWDEIISEELQEEWKMMMDSFKLIGKLKVSRKIFSLDDVDQLEKLELHGFSAASLQNFGICIYLKLIFKSGTI